MLNHFLCDVLERAERRRASPSVRLTRAAPAANRLAGRWSTRQRHEADRPRELLASRPNHQTVDEQRHEHQIGPCSQITCARSTVIAIRSREISAEVQQKSIGPRVDDYRQSATACHFSCRGNSPALLVDVEQRTRVIAVGRVLGGSHPRRRHRGRPRRFVSRLAAAGLPYPPSMSALSRRPTRRSRF